MRFLIEVKGCTMEERIRNESMKDELPMQSINDKLTRD
jgi:hypothetical protein